MNHPVPIAILDLTINKLPLNPRTVISKNFEPLIFKIDKPLCEKKTYTVLLEYTAQDMILEINEVISYMHIRRRAWGVLAIGLLSAPKPT